MKQKIAENKYFSLTSIINMNSNVSNQMNFIRSSYDDSDSKDFSLISVAGLGLGLQAGGEKLFSGDKNQLPSLDYSNTQSRHEFQPPQQEVSP